MKGSVPLLAALLLVAPGTVYAEAANPKVTTGPAADFVAPGPIVALPNAIGAAVDGLRASNLAAHIELLGGARTRKAVPSGARGWRRPQRTSRRCSHSVESVLPAGRLHGRPISRRSLSAR